MGVHSMKMKRLFAVVIAMLLVLAGCSNSNDNNETKKDDADNGKKQEIQVAADKFNRCNQEISFRI